MTTSDPNKTDNAYAEQLILTVTKHQYDEILQALNLLYKNRERSRNHWRKTHPNESICVNSPTSPTIPIPWKQSPPSPPQNIIHTTLRVVR